MAFRIDRQGAFEIDGGPVTHPRIIDALRHGIDVNDAGEPIVRLGTQWAYLTVEDTPLRATAVVATDTGLELRLDDGRVVPLVPETLVDEREYGLRCTAPARGSGRPLAVRLTNHARMDLADHLEIDDDGAATLRYRGAHHRIPSCDGDDTHARR